MPLHTEDKRQLNSWKIWMEDNIHSTIHTGNGSHCKVICEKEEIYSQKTVNMNFNYQLTEDGNIIEEWVQKREKNMTIYGSYLPNYFEMKRDCYSQRWIRQGFACHRRRRKRKRRKRRLKINLKIIIILILRIDSYQNLI